MQKLAGCVKIGLGKHGDITSRCSGGIKVIVRTHRLLAAAELNRCAALFTG
jgi:hypothetical protein